MVDFSHKTPSERLAIAEAVVHVGDPATIKAIRENKVPKGDVFAMSKAAGLLAVKNTPSVLPDCHPLPIEFTDILFKIRDLSITVTVTVKTFYKTGVEVEAMHGASITALNMYDMLKPIDKQITISHIRLVKKTGGKSDFAAT